jgi:signal transduction histidine kinase
MKRNLFDGNVVILVLRFFIAIRLIISLLSGVSSLLETRLRITDFQPIGSFIEVGLLLIFLSIPWLQRRLGRWYLPIALLWATIGPVAENMVAFINFWTGASAIRQLAAPFSLEFGRQMLLSGQFEIFIMVLLPMILISWLYPYRYLAVITLGLTSLDFVPIILLDSAGTHGIWRAAFSAILRGLVFLFLGYVINRLVADMKRQNSQLADANRRIASYATAMEQLAVSRERNRLAREFHDTLAHTLSAVAVQLEAVSALLKTNPERANAMLEQSLVITRNGLTETRRAILSLRAAPLEDMGLRMALDGLAHTTAERYGWNLKLDLSENLNDISADTEHCIYRIAEEGLHNAGEHARARNLEMKLNRGKGKIEFIIKDDGQGFSPLPDEAENHYGLQGMKERAAALGGLLSIESQPNLGTTVRFVMEEVQ